MPLILRGRYLPLSQIGIGYGTTFLAEDLYSPHRQRCVIKQLQPRYGATPQQIENVQNQFKQEVKSLEGLAAKHEQIPSLFDSFELEVLAFNDSKLVADRSVRFFYIVREYIEGQTLAEELQQKGAFSEAEAIEIMRQILPVLQFVHDWGETHQNITPANIVRDRWGRLHLIDFRLLKQMTVGGASHRAHWSFTPGFTPPELQLDQLTYASSDLYSLGIVILYLLSKQDPESMFDRQTKRWNGSFDRLKDDRLNSVLHKLLQPDLSQRFASAHEVLAALSSRTAIEGALEKIALPVQPTRTATTPLRKVDMPGARFGSTATQGFSNRRWNGSDTTTLQPHTQIMAAEPIAPPPGKSAAPPSLIQQLQLSLLLGSGSWLAAVALISFVGTLAAPGFWLLIVGGAILALAKRQSLSRKIRFLAISIAAVAATFLLLPRFGNTLNFIQSLPMLVLMATACGLFVFILLLLSQSLYDLVGREKESR